MKNACAFKESLPPRFSADAYTGVYTVGQADLMVSLDGDRQHNLYINPQGSYGSDQQWLGDLGLGYRWIKNDAAILGWYVFAGRTRVANNSSFWITNPGIEVMGSRWDVHLNGYIPVAGRSHEVGNIDYNIVSEPFFTGHTEVIVSEFNIANEIQQIGNGADARVGYQLIRHVPLKAYVGAYFFAMPNSNNMSGGAAGAEYWFDRNVKAFVNYSYDNYQHSKVVGGLGISFGGVRQEWADPTLSERLTDPVERYLANLGHGSPIPSKTNLYGMGSGSSTELISDSIAFFREQGGNPNNGGTGLTLANCTFESPCGPTDFSQAGVDTLNTLLPNTNFYFNGGSYPAVNGVNLLSLEGGQSLFSRTADYSAPATGAARSTFNGGFFVRPGSSTLENIILLPTPATQATVNYAIYVFNGANLAIIGSQIGSAANPFISGVVDFGDTTIKNSEIFANSLTVQAAEGNVLIESSTLDSNNLNNDLGSVQVYRGVTIKINNSVITAASNGNLRNNGVIVVNSTADISNSVITVAGNASITLSGILTQTNSTVTVSDSQVNVTNSDNAGRNYAFFNTGGSITRVNDSVINVNGGANTFVTNPPPNDIQIIDSNCTVNGGSVVCQ